MSRLFTSVAITIILIVTQYPRLATPVGPEPVQAQPPAGGLMI